jgi:hypothetical protein
MPSNDLKTKKTAKQRIAIVAEWLSEGLSFTEIETKGVSEFGCSKRSMATYVMRARTEVLPSWYRWGELRELAIEGAAKYEKIFRKALAAGNLDAAIKALNKVHELQGLTAPMQVARIRGEQKLSMANLKSGDTQTSTGKAKRASIAFETFNELRSHYGQPLWTQEKWEKFQLMGQKQKGD